jgi:hypothetical protein
MALCDDFPEGTRKRSICDGTIDMPLEKINRYRVAWGWSELDKKPGEEQVTEPRQSGMFDSASGFIRRLFSPSTDKEPVTQVAGKFNKNKPKGCGCKKG